MLERLVCGVTLLLSIGGAAACRSLPATGSHQMIVAGPEDIAVVGDMLFATDDFGRTLWRIGLNDHRRQRVPLPADEPFITGLADDGRGGLLITDPNSIWRIDVTSGAVRLIGGGSDNTRDADAGVPASAAILFPTGAVGHFTNGDIVVSARNLWRIGADRILQDVLPDGVKLGRPDVPYTADVRSFAVGDDDTIYAAIGGEYAADNRILRIDNTGATTLVGPGTSLSSDPRWRLRDPDALTLDHRGGLAFIDAASNAVLRLDLASGRLERLPFTFKSASDLAADTDGNLYVADRAARAIVRIDRGDRTARRVTKIGGAKEELGFTDGVLMAEEPSYTSCSNDNVPGAIEVEVVVDNAPFEAATVYRVDGERNIPRKTDASGIATFEIAESGRYVFLIDTPGFTTSVIDYRLSRSCTARIRVSPRWLRAF
jgi:hypothetical protein